MTVAELQRHLARTETRLDGHEELCADRYTALLKRLDRLERVIMTATGSLLAALLGAVLLHAKL